MAKEEIKPLPKGTYIREAQAACDDDGVTLEVVSYRAKNNKGYWDKRIVLSVTAAKPLPGKVAKEVDPVDIELSYEQARFLSNVIPHVLRNL